MSVELTSTTSDEVQISIDNPLAEQNSNHSHYEDDESEAKIALLLSACAKNNVAKVQALLNGGVSSDACDYDKRYGLHIAASEGAIDVVKLLIQEKADPNVQDRFGSTPLDDAVRCNHMEIVDYLRSHGAKQAKKITI